MSMCGSAAGCCASKSMIEPASEGVGLAYAFGE